MNIIIPDEGSIEVLGKPSTDAASRAIGYLPEERGLYRKMKVIDQLAFLGEIRGLTAKESRRRAEEWLERIDLSAWKGKKVEDLSKGMQQKVQFVGCVIHDPEIIILDEPFSGLDPVNARVLKDLILEFRQRGKTLLFSTHIMEQAEKLCDSIALINRSRLLLNGTIGEVKKRFARNRLSLRTTAARDIVAQLPMVAAVVAEADGSLEVELDSSATTAAFLREATRTIDVESAVPHDPSLDEIFVDAVGADSIQGEAA
jgi:ABC-2 type transport system ATP-binding protein